MSSMIGTDLAPPNPNFCIRRFLDLDNLTTAIDTYHNVVNLINIYNLKNGKKEAG